jgi:UDP-3-O-[3-hydroxymyristoyl] glucosamine N-acyltransferase
MSTERGSFLLSSSSFSDLIILHSEHNYAEVTNRQHWTLVLDSPHTTFRSIADFLKLKAKLHGLTPRANYTDRATAAVGEVCANFC